MSTNENLSAPLANVQTSGVPSASSASTFNVPPPLTKKSLLSTHSTTHVTNGDDESAKTKKRKHDDDQDDERDEKKKKRKTDDANDKASKSDKKKKKKSKKSEEKERIQISSEEERERIVDADDVSEDGDFEADLEQVLQSIMVSSNTDNVDDMLKVITENDRVIDQVKTFMGIGTEPTHKVTDALISLQRRALYYNMVVGELMIPVEAHRSNGPKGFIEYLLECKAKGKHVVPMALCCWDTNLKVDERKRQAALHLKQDNLWMFKTGNELIFAMQRTKFWYYFATEVDTWEDEGKFSYDELDWNTLKEMCKSVYSSREEHVQSLHKAWIYAQIKNQDGTTSRQNISRWCWPKSTQKGRSFETAIWPFVQIYFMSPTNCEVSPTMLPKATVEDEMHRDDHEEKQTVTNKYGMKHLDFDHVVKTNQHKHAIDVERKDKHGEREKTKKKHEEKKRPKNYFIDDEAEEDDDE